MVLEQEGSMRIAVLPERFDATNSKEIEQQLIALLERGCHELLLDFSGTEYVSSAALRVMVLLKKKMDGLSSKIYLCSIQPYIMEIIDTAGLMEFFTHYETRSAVINDKNR